MHRFSRKLLALLSILALSNLATNSVAPHGYEQTSPANCCAGLPLNPLKILGQEQGNLKPEEKRVFFVTVTIAFVVGLFLYSSWGQWPETGDRGPGPLRSTPGFRTTAQQWGGSPPGFSSDTVLQAAELEKVSDSEYNLRVVAADQLPGSNLKEFLALELVPLDEEARQELEDSNMPRRAFVQVRGFGHHIREEAGSSAPIASGGSTGSIVVGVYDPGETPEPAEDDWTFSVSVLPGYETFLSGPVELIQDHSGPATAQMRFLGNSSAVPAGLDFQRVPALVTATARNLPVLSKRVDLFVRGAGLGS